MANINCSQLPNGGEYMTDAQYKGLLVDQRKLLKDIREMAEAAGSAEIIERIDKELEIIAIKLAF
ncbi:MAG: hypothetical protein LIO52_00240 [Oscillospiraceae bacterium]|nr:hypothetical protein [Oscillospiraceae bacterium]